MKSITIYLFSIIGASGLIVALGASIINGGGILGFLALAGIIIAISFTILGVMFGLAFALDAVATVVANIRYRFRVRASR